MTAEPASSKKGRVTRLWVLVAVTVGILLGALMAILFPPPHYEFGPEQFFMLSIQRALMFHVFLATLEIVMLVALVLVYVKIYSVTRANFSLGLVFVLAALLVHSVLTYPLFLMSIGPVVVGSGPFFPYTDLFTIFAYVVFLYLSLE
jgi:hypothetical protein